MGDLIVRKGNHELTTTPHMVFSVNYYLDICCTIPFYCGSHLLPTNVKLVVWTLYSINM